MIESPVVFDEQEETLLLGRYVVLRTVTLSQSTYYDVVDCLCPACESLAPPAGGSQICRRCGVELSTGLVRRVHGGIPELTPEALTQLADFHPALLPQLEVRLVEPYRYVQLPGSADWQSIFAVGAPAPVEQVVAWVTEVGRALFALHQRQFAFWTTGPVGLEAMILNHGHIRLADLTGCRRFGLRRQAVQVAEGRDLIFLAELLHYLTTGVLLPRTPSLAAGELTGPVSAVIEGTLRGRYSGVTAFLADLGRQAGIGPLRGPRQSAGVATDTGRSRAENQDAVGSFQISRRQIEPGLALGCYVVADGLGGQQAGAVASRTVCEVMLEQCLDRQWVAGLESNQTPAAQMLAAMVRQANHRLVQDRRAADDNRSSTLVTALVVGERAAIANCGDSRAYVLRDRQLRQITRDHSIVADLVAAGIIQPAEAMDHPQQNQIYRSLGESETLEVDLFQELLQPGDRLLLCSDGLWKMIPSDQLSAILRQPATPQVICEELIRAANASGGTDNISVVVVEIL